MERDKESISSIRVNIFIIIINFAFFSCSLINIVNPLSLLPMVLSSASWTLRDAELKRAIPGGVIAAILFLIYFVLESCSTFDASQKEFVFQNSSLFAGVEFPYVYFALISFACIILLCIGSLLVSLNKKSTKLGSSNNSIENIQAGHESIIMKKGEQE